MLGQKIQTTAKVFFSAKLTVQEPLTKIYEFRSMKEVVSKKWPQKGNGSN